MARNLKAAVDLAAGVAVVAIEGEVSSSSGPILEQAMEAAAETGSRKMLLAFRDQDELASSAIAVLVHLIVGCQGRGIAVRIAHPSTHARWSLDVMGISKNVDVFPSSEAALEGF